jgi:short-subunit dehydrogenase
VGLSRSLRAEAKAYGVQVCAICPGFIRTPMADTGKLVGRLPREKALAEIDRLGWMSPGDLARAALRGVGRNRSIIVAPGWMRALVALFRIFPALGDRFAEYGVRRMRKMSDI